MDIRKLESFVAKVFGIGDSTKPDVVDVPVDVYSR